MLGTSVWPKGLVFSLGWMRNSFAHRVGSYKGLVFSLGWMRNSFAHRVGSYKGLVFLWGWMRNSFAPAPTGGICRRPASGRRIVFGLKSVIHSLTG
jgi:hypothetical protein